MFFKQRPQKDFAAEIESHISIEAERLREEGMSERDALRSARRAFGNPLAAEERFYDSTHTLWLDQLRKDLQYAIRTLRRSPAFTSAAVLTLALGIGANTALFTIIDSVLLRPLPYPDPERLVMLYSQSGGEKGSLAPADFLDYRAQSHGFEHLAAYRETPLNISGNGIGGKEAQSATRVNGAIVTPDFFEVMKTAAELGRTFSSQIDHPGVGRLIVLSDALWRTSYGGAPDILGKTIDLDGEPHTVVGVMPANFRFPDQSVAWTLAHYAVPEHALRPQIDLSGQRDTHYFDAIGRLAPGVSLAQSRAEMSTIARRLKEQFGKDEEADNAAVIPLQEDLVGGTKTALLILLASVTLLLLIACVNVANILLARGASRQKEIAIRGALGAGKWRIVRQLLTESLVVAACGGALGILFAYGALMLRTWIPADMLAGADLQLDVGVLAFTAITALGCGLFFGLVPALQMAKPDLNVALKEGGRGSTGDRSSQRTRNLLVVSEIALATVLLIGAGLLIRSFSRVLAAPEGFHPEHVLTLQTSLGAARYPDAAKRAAFARQTLERIRAVPGVLSASVISRLPLNRGRSTRGVMVKGHSPFANDEADYLVISPDYFSAMGIGVMRGRTFTERDDAAIILNESAARKFFAGQEPLGQFIRFDTDAPWLEVLGVVADVRQHQLDRSSEPAVYVPFSHEPWPFMAFAVRMRPLEPWGVQAAIHQVDKDQALYNVRSMEEVVSGSVSSRRFGMTLLGLFAGLALVLACVGIYGVIAYSVAQRLSEIGIRVALGAEPRAVLGMILLKGLRLAVAGVGLGVVLSAGLTRFLANILYGVRATDAVTFSGSAGLLIAVAILASYVPAWRAAQVDPVIALRAE